MLFHRTLDELQLPTNREKMKCFGSLKQFSYSLDRCREGKRHFLTKTLTSKQKERKGASMTCERGCEMEFHGTLLFG